MLSLTLLRHGKSDWTNDLNDHDRPLAPRGIRSAKAIGNFLSMSEQVPSLVITSSAQRARDTLQLAIRQGNWDSKIEIDARLYATTTDAVIERIHEVTASAKHLMLVGHEPTWSELTAALTNNNGSFRFPTGAMARIDFDIDNWSQLQKNDGELRWLIPPKLLTKALCHWRC